MLADSNNASAGVLLMALMVFLLSQARKSVIAWLLFAAFVVLFVVGLLW